MPDPDALLLALDTSAPIGTVAVGRAGAPGEPGEVLARRILRRQGTHAAHLVPRIAEALDEAGVGRDALDGVVVGAGPGSFTGVRVAAATAKGLVRSLGVPLWALSSLEAGAVTADLRLPELDGRPLGPDDARRPRLVLFDARGERVYAGQYRVEESGVRTLVPPRPDRIGAVLEMRPEAGTLFMGDGAVLHRERIEAAGHRVLPPPAGLPTADALLRVLALEPERTPEEDPARWEPRYLRAWRPRGETATG